MTGFGLIAVIPAYRQYQAAIDRYNDLVEYKDGLEVAIRAYNIGKNETYLLNHMVDEKPNEAAPGLLLAPMLRVGNLVGKLFRVQASVVMTNTGSTPIQLDKIRVECNVLDAPIKVYKFKEGDNEITQSIDVYKTINPGETLEVKLKSGISSLGDLNGQLRDLICEAAGKKLITSCPNTSIDDGIKADILYNWQNASLPKEQRTNDDLKQCYMIGKPGVLRYCGEAFYPKD